MRAICRGGLSVTIAHVMATYAGEAGGTDRYELEMVSPFPYCSVKPDRKKNKLVVFSFLIIYNLNVPFVARYYYDYDYYYANDYCQFTEALK